MNLFFCRERCAIRSALRWIVRQPSAARFTDVRQQAASGNAGHETVEIFLLLWREGGPTPDPSQEGNAVASRPGAVPLLPAFTSFRRGRAGAGGEGGGGVRGGLSHRRHASTFSNRTALNFNSGSREMGSFSP